MPVVDSALDRKVHVAAAGVLFSETVGVAFATTQLDNTNDQTLVYEFGSDSDLYLVDLRVDTDDLDDATALTLNIGVGDSDGTIDTSIIATSTAGQTGASDWPDATAALPVAVTSKYLIVDVGTAAGTAVAGSIYVTPIMAFYPDFQRTS